MRSVLLVLALFGCEERSRPPAAAASCVPGETQECLGAGRCEGAQPCNEEGAGWAECVCDEPVAPGGGEGEGEAAGDGEGEGEVAGEGEAAGKGEAAGEG